MGLAKYQSMRRFSKTPEPKGKVKHASSKKLEFVIHKHAATRLHYDFRLELDGVLKSWAVPKGPSMNPKDRRLAVAVEDHPYDYRKFEGIIPEGNYGAGEVIIWDKGTYTDINNSDDPVEPLREGLKKGDLKFEMHGEKLKGKFALVKSSHDDKNWFLIKKKDEFASNEDIAKKDKSVVSGKHVEDLREKEVDLSKLPEQKPPEFIKPMLATLIDKPFSKSGWLFELKLDGYRAVGAKRSDKVQLYSRNDQDFSVKYAPIAEALQSLPNDTVIDGEIVVLDEDGKPKFNWLQGWQHTEQGTLAYFVFDVMWCKGRNVTSLPLVERKQLLRELLPNNPRLIYCDHVEERGEDLFKEIQKVGMEGIMAKQSDSPYLINERSKYWLKIKTHLRQEVVIAGFTEPRGSRKYIGSLLLGVYEGQDLIYVGHSGGGIPTEQLKSLRQQLEKLERKTSPFKTQPKPNAPVHWVEPKLVCEVTFAEWTPDERMRQPKFVGLRVDKKPEDVHREVAVSTKAAAQTKTLSMRKPSSTKLTHLDKVFFPEAGITKGDLIDYYKSVSKYMLPYIIDHPHVLNRHPNGAGKPSFFQKDIENPAEGIKTVRIHSESTNEDINYFVCTGLDSLLYMAQLGCIEINPWHAKAQTLHNPEWVIMDLDPQGVDFPVVVRVARTIKKLCDEWGLPSYPKTSGKKGLHVYIPTGAKYDDEQIRQFAELMAIEINKYEPEITSLERTPSKRRGKVYIDYLRNARGQTVVAPYSVRPTPEATVSMPLDWQEVNDKLKPTDFTIKTALKHIQKSDPWENMLKQSFDMVKLLEKIS